MNEPQTQQTRRERLTAIFWARHSNPWSGWSRTLGHPALVAALYHRSWRGVAACIGYFIINPLLFPPPKNTDNWMSQGVLGERLWTSGYNPQQWRLPTWLNIINLPVFVVSLVTAYQRKLTTAIAATLLTAVTKLWFIDRMARLYELHQQEQLASQTTAAGRDRD
jgi:hypothetical protein